MSSPEYRRQVAARNAREQEAAPTGSSGHPGRPYSQPSGPSALPFDRREVPALEAPTRNNTQARFGETSPSSSRRTVSDDYRGLNSATERPSRERSVSDIVGSKGPHLNISGPRSHYDASFRNYPNSSRIPPPELQPPPDHWRGFATDGAAIDAVPRTIIRSREGPDGDRTSKEYRGELASNGTVLEPYQAEKPKRRGRGSRDNAREADAFWEQLTSTSQLFSDTPARGDEPKRPWGNRQPESDRPKYGSVTPSESFRATHGRPPHLDDRYSRAEGSASAALEGRRYGPPDSQSEQPQDRFATSTPTLDARLRRDLEDSQLPREQRNLLNAIESSRRLDRVSPLPQAVQGASSQPAGAGRDPTIKSEFGRMFSGLGSGFTGTPQPNQPTSNGSPTPARQSRAAGEEEQDGDSMMLTRPYEPRKRTYANTLARADVEDTVKPRGGYKGRKRSKHDHVTEMQQTQQPASVHMQPHHHHPPREHPLAHQ